MTKQQLVDDIVALSFDLPSEEKYRNYLGGLCDKALLDKLNTLKLERTETKRGYSRFNKARGIDGDHEQPMRLDNMELGGQKILL